MLVIDRLQTHVQRKVQAQNIRSREQLVEAHVLCTSCALTAHLSSVVVDGLHTKDIHLDFQIPADASHTKNAQSLALRVVTKSRRWRALPFSFTQCLHRRVEIAQSTKDEEHGGISSAVIGNGRDVGDQQRRISRGASVSVYLIISGAIMGEESPALWGGLHQFLIKDTCDAHGGERSVGSDYIIKSSALALGNELVSIRGVGSYDLCNFGQLLPCLVSATLMLEPVGDIEVPMDEQDDLAELENLRLGHDYMLEDVCVRDEVD